MSRLLVYRPAAERSLSRMDRSDAGRIIRASEPLPQRSERPVSPARRQVAHLFSLDQPGSVVVAEVDNRGQAY